MPLASLAPGALTGWWTVKRGMARDSDHTEHEKGDRSSGEDWSVMDVEDLRDFAKVMTIDDLATVMMRSRHEIRKKLIELGLSAVKRRPNATAES